MSDISNSNSSRSSKRRLSQIDETIEHLTQEVNTLNDFEYKSEFESSLMTVKIKRDKVKALSVIAKSHVILANMEVLIAENDLFTEIERLWNKRTKLDRNESKSQVTPAVTKKTVSVQTIESMSNKKKKTRHSSSKKSPVDISLDKTVIIQSIHESSASLAETSQTSPVRSFSLGLFNKTPEYKSDSDVSLSCSFKAEFNEPYTKTQTQEPVKKSPSNKLKPDKKVKSKNNSKHISKGTPSPTALPKTVADLRKSVNTASSHMVTSSCAVTQNSSTGNQKSTGCATCVPIVDNMGVFLTQPSTATMHPFLHVNPATQANIQYHSQKADKSDFVFYCSKQ